MAQHGEPRVASGNTSLPTHSSWLLGLRSTTHRREDEAWQASVASVGSQHLQHNFPLRGAATTLARPTTTLQRVVDALGTADASASVSASAPSTLRVNAVRARVGSVARRFLKAATPPRTGLLFPSSWPGRARRGRPHPRSLARSQRPVPPPSPAAVRHNRPAAPYRPWMLLAPPPVQRRLSLSRSVSLYLAVPAAHISRPSLGAPATPRLINRRRPPRLPAALRRLSALLVEECCLLSRLSARPSLPMPRAISIRRLGRR